MNREIKFRAFDTEMQKYSEGQFILSSVRKREITLEGVSVDVDADDSNEEVIFEQFTGLKDKNFKEIYEGDVMRWESGEIGVVKYEANACQFRIEISEGVSMHIGLNTAGKGTAVVIGNIHENPELL